MLKSPKPALCQTLSWEILDQQFPLDPAFFLLHLPFALAPASNQYWGGLDGFCPPDFA